MDEFFRLAFTVMCHVHPESSEWPEVVVVNERRAIHRSNLHLIVTQVDAKLKEQTDSQSRRLIAMSDN